MIRCSTSVKGLKVLDPGTPGVTLTCARSSRDAMAVLHLVRPGLLDWPLTQPELIPHPDEPLFLLDAVPGQGKEPAVPEP